MRSLVLLEELRTATAEPHRRVEQLPPVAALLGAHLTLCTYLETLRRFWRFHAAQESRLDDGALPPQHRVRPHLTLLERDLGGRPERVPRAAGRGGSLAASVGILYVVEGSALGGIVIGRHLRRFPELAGRTAFFSRSERQVAKRWRGFCKLVADLDNRPPSFRREAVRGACAAFAEASEILGGAACNRTSTDY